MSDPAPPSLPVGAPASPAAADNDPYLWLEEVQGERALAWVRDRNAATRALLQARPDFSALRDGFRKILDSRDKIPQVSRRGHWLYNLWRDADHPRGLWRRTTLGEYRRPAPDWETVIDLDALGRAEGENWVWGGARCLGPDYERCLVSLSRGGADATVVREFDTRSKAFVDGGFSLPEAKSSVEWLSADEVYVGIDVGPGSLTESGYPRQLRRWRRGQALADATLVFEGLAQDVAVDVSVDRTPGFERTVFSRATDFYNTALWLGGPTGQRRIEVPSDAITSFWRDRVLLQLRSDWQPAAPEVATAGGPGTAAPRWPAGTLLVGDAGALLAGRPVFEPLFQPTPGRSLAGFSTTRSRVLLSLLDEVAGRLEEWQHDGKRWSGRRVDAPFPGSLSACALYDSELADDPLAEAYLLGYADFLHPDALMLGRTGSDERELLKSLPAFFDTSGMKVEQRFARSKDGARVPYFVVRPAPPAAGTWPDGPQPTLLYGYGGFEVSQLPWYSASFGSAWVGRGGVLVVANIRGGGEYGPAWHQAAVKAHKQRSYDDFAAVAEDLIASGVTDASRLGIEGGSNGGLLVAAVMLQRPELFGAVVCQVPLLDMRRYHRLLAGASWVAEYGDPDQPEEWAWISGYSPYQNLRPGMKLPPVLFTTSTRDDRVHPGHARKMVARMAEFGYAPLYYENTEGGHGGAADNAQRADMLALEFAFLWQQLGL